MVESYHLILCSLMKLYMDENKMCCEVFVTVKYNVFEDYVIRYITDMSDIIKLYLLIQFVLYGCLGVKHTYMLC